MSHEFDIRRQLEVAHALQTLLVITGILCLGAALGYYMSITTVADTTCGNPLLQPDVCQPILADLNEQLIWFLGVGAVTIAAAGFMEYVLRTIDI